MSVRARVAVLCGKGGVGKSTLSLALALRLAREKRKVLVVTSHPLPELALGISLEGLSARFPGVSPNLHVLYIDPRELIAGLVNRSFAAGILAQTILNSTIYKNLIEVAPGLKEFFFLGRLQQLAEGTAESDSAEPVPQYDFLIWDAPASGHFLNTLRAARNFEKYVSGPLGAAGAELHRFLSDSTNLLIYPVTLLEEMAIAETLEMTRALETDFQIPSAAVLVNCASPMCTASEAEIAGLPAADASDGMRFAIDRGLIEREHARELGTGLPVTQIVVPRIAHYSADLDLLAQVGEHLALPQLS